MNVVTVCFSVLIPHGKLKEWPAMGRNRGTLLGLGNADCIRNPGTLLGLGNADCIRNPGTLLGLGNAGCIS